MTTWEEVEQQPEFGVLSSEDKASLHKDWHEGVLNSLVDEDPEKVDPAGVSRFVAAERARNESFKTGQPFDDQAAQQAYAQQVKDRVGAQKRTLADLEELDRSQFALKDAAANRGVTSGADRGMPLDPRVIEILDKDRKAAQQTLDEVSSRFTPEQLQQAKEAKATLNGERPTAVLGSDLYTDPALVLDKDKYRAAVAESDASPEAKARAMADFTSKRKQVAEQALRVLRIAGESPLPGAQDFPTWEASQPEDVRRLSPEDKALQYMRTMQGRGDFRKLTSAIGTGLLQGGTDIASQGLGVAAMASNSGELARQAAEVADGASTLEEVSKLEGDKQATGATTAGGAARLLPPMAATIAPAVLTGGGSLGVAAGLSGLQTAGAQFPTTYKALIEQGMSEEEALSASRNAAITSGLITAGLTAAFGKTGAEAALLTGAGGKELVKSRLLATLKGAAKGAGAEIPEELLDEAASQVIEQRTIDPNKPVSQIVDEFAQTAPDLAMQIALLGGVGGGVGSFRGSTTTPGGTPTVPETAVQPTAPEDNDFSRRAAMEGATEFRPNQGIPVQVEGTTIATIPEGSPLTPEDVAEFAGEPDTMKAMARNNFITLPEIVTPVPGVDPAITEAMNENIATSAALAPQTVEALKQSQTPSDIQDRRQQIQARLVEIQNQHGPREDVVIGADGNPDQIRPRRINTTEEDALLKEIESINEAENAPTTPPAIAESSARNTELFPEKTDFMGKLSQEAVLSNYQEKDGFGVAEYANPTTGLTDVYLAAFGDNDFIAYIRVYDENGKPTNRFTSKLERRSNAPGATKKMLSELQSRLPAGHEYTEDVSVSTDGLKFIAGQLRQGYEVALDESGNPVTQEVAVSGESLVNDLPIAVDPNGKFENIRITNRAEFEKVRSALGRMLGQFGVGLNEQNVRWENGTAFIDIPVLRKKVSPVTTETETPANAANVDGGSQSVQTEPAGGSIPAVTANTVSTSDIASTAEVQPTQAPPTPVNNVVVLNPADLETIPEDLTRAKENQKSNNERWQQAAASTEPISVIQMPDGKYRILDGHHRALNAIAKGEQIQAIVEKPWAPAVNEPATFTADNGQKVVGTVSNIAPNGKATVQFVWNGKDQSVTIPASQLSRPITSLADGPRYVMTQEQNTRKAGKHFPTAPGVHENFDFNKAFASMADDTSLSKTYREVARLLSKLPGFGNVDLHIVADGRKRYAGEYSHHNGKSAIAVNLRQVARGNVDALGTILHEALHHLTMAKVHNPQGDVELDAVAAIHQLRQKAEKFAKDNGQFDKFWYELGSNEEFITGLFTRPDFQGFLASIPDSAAGVGKFRSILSEVFRRIAELLTGKHVPAGSTLEQSIASILALFETPHRAHETGGLEKLSAVRSGVEGSPTVQTAVMFDGKPLVAANGVTHYDLLKNWIKKNLLQPYQRENADEANALADQLLTNAFLREHKVQEGFMVNGEFKDRQEALQAIRDAMQSVPGATAENRDWLDSSDLAGTPKSMAEDEASEPDPSTARTRAKFFSPRKEFYVVQGDKEATDRAFEWINRVGPVVAARKILTNSTPAGMTPNEVVISMGALFQGFTEASTDPSTREDEKTVARATIQQLGDKWTAMGSEAAREMRQRGVQNGAVLQPIAPILAANEVLVRNAEKILTKQFDGGAEGTAPKVVQAKEKADAEADERLENIIARLMGSMSPKQTAVGALAKMFRGKGERDSIVEEVAKALMIKARGNVVTPERKTALANLVSSLKSTLAASVKGEKKPAPERTMQDLLTAAFVNQVSEGATFEEAWKAGRQKVLDMLIDIELDKAYHPAEARLTDLRAKLTHLEAGNADQQKANAAEREQLATQITATKAEMKSAMDAVKAMTPALETQRDGLMPSAPTVAFDPTSSKEVIGRAFEKAGYTAELATGLDKNGKRALSIKDALLNRQRATDAVMKVFDEAMAAKDAVTQNDWPQARAFALRAVKETLDSWQAQMDTAKAAKLEATKQNLLSEDSKALEKLVNSIRAKIAPDADWSDILQDLPRTQDERLAAIKDRVAKHEALKNLTPDEAIKLAENIDKLWQRERLKAFQDELLKAGVLKAKTVKAAVNVASVAPELIRLMNLGVFNASTFREAIAKRFGIKLMSNAQADALRKMAASAWELPEGVLRNNKLDELVRALQHITAASWSDIVSSYWAASVLSGLNTQFNTWGALLNGLATNLIQAGGQLTRGNGAAAVGAQLQWWKALNQGMNDAAYIMWTGDTSFTKSFEPNVLGALNGDKGHHPIAIGEKMWKDGTALQKIPGLLMTLVGRSMIAADHVNNTATTQGAMAIARAMNPTLYDGKTSWTQKEISDAHAQALQETTAGEKPTTWKEERMVSARTREILNAGVTEVDRAQASDVGDIAAFQNEPTGLFGGLYRGVKAMLSSWVRGLDEKAQDEEATTITRAICAVGAGSVYAATGTRFMRYGFNIGNEYIRYMPGSWVLNKVVPILGSNLSPMQQEMLLGKNLVGAMILGTLYAMFGGDDDEDESKWKLEGPWDTLSADEKSARRTAGYAPNTMSRVKDGKMERISYGQWAAAGIIGAAGSMLDEKRYNPEEWAQRGPAGHMLRGAVTGLFQVQNVAALENLAKVLGAAPSYGQDKVQGPVDRIIEAGTAYAGGFTPTFLKDLDKWDDPRNFKADGAWEKLIREMPIARRYVQDGRAQFNRLGDDVRVHREPYSRLYTADQIDKATAAYGNLIARGIDFPNPSTSRKIVKDGKKVPMDSLGKGVTYDFEKAVAAGYKQFLEEHGEKLAQMPTTVADKVVQRRAQVIIDLEAHKVQAKVSNP